MFLSLERLLSLFCSAAFCAWANSSLACLAFSAAIFSSIVLLRPMLDGVGEGVVVGEGGIRGWMGVGFSTCIILLGPGLCCSCWVAVLGSCNWVTGCVFTRTGSGAIRGCICCCCIGGCICCCC